MNLNTTKIAFLNSWRSPFRSIGLLVLIAVFSTVILAGGLFSLSLDQGLSVVGSRLGADVILIPSGSDIEKNGLFLQGDTKQNFLPQDLLKFVQSHSGVDQATPQHYFTTLGTSCCEKKVSVIGFDPKSDFVILPWIRQVLTKGVPAGSLVVGSDLQIGSKNSIRFFDQEFPVAAQLEPVGNKLDQAVFATTETVAQIRAAAEKKGYHFVSDESEVSAILLKLKKGADVNQLSQDIHFEFDGVQIFERKDMFGTIEKTVHLFQRVSWILAGFFLVIAIVALSVSFSVSANARKKEFAVIRVVGGTRKKLRRIVIAEAALVSSVGALVGTLFGSLVFFPFRVWIVDVFEVPFLLPPILTIVGVYVVALIVPFAVGPLAASRVAFRVGNLDAYQVLREGER
ncbi:MAG: ABC transporter permease [Fibrobacter sp.]|nr:ABC transporter permease [Fibrobacter sp.]